MNTNQSDQHANAAVRYKQEAGEYAVRFVESGMAVGLGTGSTAIHTTHHLGLLLQRRQLHDVVAFATSQAIKEEAMRLGIPLLPDDLPRSLDVTIDGADEVDPQLNVIKGGGGAHLREKIVAQASRRFVIVVDDSKLSSRLGTLWAVPVEVLPYGWRAQAMFLESLGARVRRRLRDDGSPFVTDNGNWVLDCAFGPMPDPHLLAAKMAARAGILEHGLFLDMATDLVVAGPGGVRHASRQDLPADLFAGS